VISLRTAIGDDMHDALRSAAGQGPVATEGETGATLVLRHADVEALARDHRLNGVGLTFFDFMGISDGPLRDWYGGLMFTNDGPAHDRLRSLVSRAFTPRAVEQLRGHAAQLADDIVARVARDGGGDLVDAFALLAMRVMCRLLGVPDADVEIFGAWADALSPVFGVMDPDQITAATTAIVDLLAYVRELADRRRDDPADDLITALIAAESEGEKLTHDETVAMVANLLVGGHDTTASQIGCSLLTLLRHPEEAARLRDTGAGAGVSHAATETIRFEPSIPFVPRTAVEPVTVAGTELLPGSMVMLVTAAANREPGVWKEPDRFDATRFAAPGAPRLLSFGAGPHYCLGAALARLTVEEAIRSMFLTDRTTFTFARDEPVEWRQVLGRSPARLAVTATG